MYIIILLPFRFVYSYKKEIKMDCIRENTK